MAKTLAYYDSFKLPGGWTWGPSFAVPMTYRIIIPATALVHSGGIVRVKFSAVAHYDIGSAFIGHQSTGYSFDGNQKRITFNGSNGVHVTRAGVLSDEFFFELDETKNVIISFYLIQELQFPIFPLYVFFSGASFSKGAAGDSSGDTTCQSATWWDRWICAVELIMAGDPPVSLFSLHTNTLLSDASTLVCTNSFSPDTDPVVSAVFTTNSLNELKSPVFCSNSFCSMVLHGTTFSFPAFTAFLQTQSAMLQSPVIATQGMPDRKVSTVFCTNALLQHNGHLSSVILSTGSFGNCSVFFTGNNLNQSVSSHVFCTYDLENKPVFAPFMATNSIGSMGRGFFLIAMPDRKVSTAFCTNTILEKNKVISYFFGTFGFQDPAPALPMIPKTNAEGEVEWLNPSQAYDILLDGVSIKDMVTSCKIEHGEDALHNRVDLSSSTKHLFRKTNPRERRGESRIEVRIGDRSLKFLLEDNPGDEDEFSFNGRSMSALISDSFFKDWTYTTDRDVSASELSKQFGDLCGLETDWQILGCAIPKGTEFTGSPIQAIERMAEIQGAIVRCSDDGVVVIRKKDKISPSDIPYAKPVIEYSRTNTDKIDYSYQYGEHYNSVDITGWQGEGEESPDIEEETPESPTEDEIICDKTKAQTTGTERKIGDTVIMRVYWAGGKLPTHLKTYATSGALRYLGRSSTTHKSRIEFKDYAGSVEKPIAVLLNIEWIGTPGHSPEWTKYKKEITLSYTGPSIAVADVTYSSEFHRYSLTGSSVETVIAALIYGTDSGFDPLTVKLQGVSSVRTAPAISDDLIRTDPIAIARGEAFLNDASYDRKINSISAPYYPDAVDGAIVSLENEKLEIRGNAKITKVTTIIDPPEIWQELEISQCQAL